MKSLFVSASAFISLNDQKDKNHNAAVNFVQQLFNQTVKVYSSKGEVVLAADVIQERLGNKKMLQFLRNFENGGITILEESSDLFPSAIKMIMSVSTRSKLTLGQAVMILLVRKIGIKDLFTFDKYLRNFHVLVWPR